MNAEKMSIEEKFDYIIISGTVGDLEDVQNFFKSIRSFAHGRTRIIIDHYNHLWQPILRLGEVLGLKTPQVYKNWLPTDEIKNLLYLSNFQMIKEHNRMLFPIYIPLFSTLINTFIAKMPLIKNICLNRFVIVKPLDQRSLNKERSVSIIIPARNEKGTIGKIVSEIPVIGKKTEIIFIEGHSIDGTRQEIKQIINKYKSKDIRLILQEKKSGKADAVHLGFAAAKGEILIIFDADLSVPIKDIKKFYEALISQKGEFVSGSRLIYPMEKKSMRLLNLIGNIIFGKIFTWLLEHHVTDTLCGTKAIWKKDYRRIRKTIKSFGDFDPFGDFELLFAASRMNLKHIEIPIRYKARIYGKSNIHRWRHFLLLLRMCWIAFWRFKII